MYEAVKEESAIVAKGAGFQGVSEDDPVELLESHSFLLTNGRWQKWAGRCMKKHRMTSMMRM
jgi:hypothetical protein